MRKTTIFVGVCVIFSAIAACVGDAPATPPEDAGSADGAAAGDGGGTDSASPGDASDAAIWTPASLPGLVLWLDDSSIDLLGGNMVDKWQDKSGKLNDAFHFADGGSPIPLVSTSGSGIGGKPSVRFTGAREGLYIQDSATLRWDATGFLLAVVAKQSAPSSGYDGGDPTTGYIYRKFSTSFAGPVLGASTSQPTAFVDTTDGVNLTDASIYQKAALIRFRWIPDSGLASGTLELVSGGATATNHYASLPDISAMGFDVNLGIDGAFPFVGDVASIIAVKGPTSDGDVRALDAYLTARYGL